MLRFLHKYRFIWPKKHTRTNCILHPIFLGITYLFISYIWDRLHLCISCGLGMPITIDLMLFGTNRSWFLKLFGTSCIFVSHAVLIGPLSPYPWLSGLLVILSLYLMFFGTNSISLYLMLFKTNSIFISHVVWD